MAKFGVFSGALTAPNQEYEGDFMRQDGQFVMIFKRNASGVAEQVAAIRLDENQSVKKIG